MKVKLLLAASFFSLMANAQVTTINENFENFTTANSAVWPQQGWSKVAAGPLVYADGTTNKYIQLYSLFSPNVAGYVITPQIVAPDGTTQIKFDAATTVGTAGTGTIQVGLVSGTSNADMATFTEISPVIALNSTTETTYTYNVPASDKQYIAFKMIGAGIHVALQVDNVVYGTNLAVTDSSFKNKDIKFALSSDKTAIQFVSDKVSADNVKIYSTSGQIVTEGKVNNNRYDVSKLNKGVYMIVIEDNYGKQTKSKFVK